MGDGLTRAVDDRLSVLLSDQNLNRVMATAGRHGGDAIATELQGHGDGCVRRLPGDEDTVV